MYKLVKSLENNEISSITKNQGHVTLSIPVNSENSDYQKFIQDVTEQGIEIVEGPDIHELSYKELRAAKYPSREEQLDMMYWDKVNGTTIWEDTIQTIKDNYPKTIIGGITIGPVPDWVMEEVNKYKYKSS